MSKQENKIKVDFVTFKTQLSVDYFVMKLDHKPLSLLYKDNIAVLKEYNRFEYIQTKNSSQYFQLAGEQKSGKLEKLKQNISL